MRGFQAQEKLHGAFEGVLGGGDGTVVSRLGIAMRLAFEDSDDGFCFMKVESEVECH